MYIGIDLGTSNSAIAGIVDGVATVFRPADGGEVLPSVIYVDKRGHRLFGRRAHDLALTSPDNVAAGFKRLMGTATKIELKGAGVALTPEECSADIIGQLLGQVAVETGGAPVDGAIITIPAAFNQMQAEATLRAAKLAGLERVDLLQEPVAAALAAMAGAKRSGQFLIYDLGGGTFDVALAQALDGDVRIVAQQGINMLGGRDFDRMIVNAVVRPWLLEHFDLPDTFQRDPQYQRLIRLAHLAAEKAKIELSAKEETSVFASEDDVRLMDGSDSPLYLDAPLTRERFQGLIREPVAQTIAMIRELLKENNYAAEDVDRVVFIGGPSRIPLIRDMVSRELGIAADLKVDPMTAVAVGAAYYCESRRWDKEGPEAGLGGSVPKPAQTRETPAGEPNLSFDYAARTPDVKTVITVRVAGPLPEARQIRLVSDAWDSGDLPLTDGLTIMVPLKKPGENIFEAEILDLKGKKIPGPASTLSITRVVATTGSIPAAQTIAVKALESARSQNNILLPLIAKDTPLPLQGQARFTSGRALKSGAPGAISFELFQVEYPERIDLNLCVGLFRIRGDDLPEGQEIKAGDPLVFDWSMSAGGILKASVQLPNANLELKVPRFYAPQAGEVSFDAQSGLAFAGNVLKQGEEEWGDLAAALGPEGGPDVQMLKARLVEQKEILDESSADPETIRRVVEESRFIRQDIARLGKRHRGPMLQRRLGKMGAIFNRVARAHATAEETARFDQETQKVQRIIDDGEALAFEDADLVLESLRDLFFRIAWRDPDYVLTWYRRLGASPWVFPDAEEFQALLAEGEACRAKGDREGLKNVVVRMLEARIATTASDIAGEPATIIKG